VGDRKPPPPGSFDVIRISPQVLGADELDIGLGGPVVEFLAQPLSLGPTPPRGDAAHGMAREPDPLKPGPPHPREEIRNCDQGRLLCFDRLHSSWCFGILAQFV